MPEVKLLCSEGDIMRYMAKGVRIRSRRKVAQIKGLGGKHHLKEGEEAFIVDADEDILLKHGRTNLRGILKGRIDSKGLEEDLKKLRREWTV